MKKIIFLLFLSAQSNAQEILHFSANLKNETLAEEAIQLLHCLAEKSDSNWEISDSLGKHYLSLKEQRKDLAIGVYSINNIETKIELSNGTAKDICSSLYPQKELNPKMELEKDTTQEWPSSAPAEIKKNNNIIWIGVGVAIIGGFLYWKSKQPEHRTILMR